MIEHLKQHWSSRLTEEEALEAQTQETQKDAASVAQTGEECIKEHTQLP